LRTYNNLADMPLQLDRFAEAVAVGERGLALARARGDRRWEQFLGLNITTSRIGLGQWDALPPLDGDGLPFGAELAKLTYLSLIARVQAGRGDLKGLERTLELATERAGSTNIEYGLGPRVASAIALRALGRNAEALEMAVPVALSGPEIPNEDRREAYIEAGLAALTIGDEETVERLTTYVAELPPAMRSPLLRAGAARLEGLLAQRRGDLRVADQRFAAAERELRAVETPFPLGQVLIERAEVLRALDREDEAAPLILEGRRLFDRLRATPWLERADALGSVVPA
jgi:hypothetical protein